jgi:hypothetical protein
MGSKVVEDLGIKIRSLITQSSDYNQLIEISGPHGSGKSYAALGLDRELQGEVVYINAIDWKQNNVQFRDVILTGLIRRILGSAQQLDAFYSALSQYSHPGAMIAVQRNDEIKTLEAKVVELGYPAGKLRLLNFLNGSWDYKDFQKTVYYEVIDEFEKLCLRADKFLRKSTKGKFTSEYAPKLEEYKSKAYPNETGIYADFWHLNELNGIIFRLAEGLVSNENKSRIKDLENEIRQHGNECTSIITGRYSRFKNIKTEEIADTLIHKYSLMMMDSLEFIDKILEVDVSNKFRESFRSSKTSLDPEKYPWSYKLKGIPYFKRLLDQISEAIPSAKSRLTYSQEKGESVLIEADCDAQKALSMFEFVSDTKWHMILYRGDKPITDSELVGMTIEELLLLTGKELANACDNTYNYLVKSYGVPRDETLENEINSLRKSKPNFRKYEFLVQKISLLIKKLPSQTRDYR